MKYVLYCRKSTDTEDKQVMSLESQEREMLEIASKNGLEVVKTLTESKSAKAQGRPVFASLLASIEAGEVEGILCWKLDRLARNMADAGHIIDSLQRGVIKEIRTHEAVHLPSENVLMLAVQLGMANQYVRDLSENVKRGNREKLRRGEWPNHAPYGYKNNTKTKKLAVDRKVAPIVVRIFELYVSGQYSLSGVVKQLYLEGFRTSTGTRIRKSRIEATLKNPIYYGEMVRNGEVFVGTHKPLISQELFVRAQNVSRGTMRPKERKLLSPFRGLLRCADCECMYTATLKKEYLYYYCTNGKGGCEAHKKYLRSELVDKLIAKALEEIRFDDEIIEIMYEANREKYKNELSYSTAIKERLRKHLRELETSERLSFDAYSKGLVSQELFGNKQREIQSDRATTNRQYSEAGDSKRLVALERIKNGFKQANTLSSRFLKAGTEEKYKLASEVLWNASVKAGKIKEIRFKAPYEILAKAPKNSDLTTLLAVWDSNATPSPP